MKNRGDDDGVALYVNMIYNVDVNMSHCIFDSNTGGGDIVYASYTSFHR